MADEEDDGIGEVDGKVEKPISAFLVKTYDVREN